MKRYFILLLLFSVSVFAAEEHEKNYVPLGCYQDTDMSTAQALIGYVSTPGATHALWQATGAAIRWRDDGVAPTSAIGMEQPAGSQYKFLYNGVLGRVQVIEVGTSAVFDICYYK